jgi:hypothetical protein
MRVPRSSIVLLTSAAAALGTASTAGAAPWDSEAFGPGIALDAPFDGSVNDPRVAIASDETAVAAWYTSYYPSVRVATRAPGAAWSTAPVDLTALAPADDALGELYEVDDVQVATGRDGTVVVSWFEDHAEAMIIRTAVRRGTGPWVVSSPSGAVAADLEDPFVAVSDTGEVAVAWVDESDDDAQLRLRTLAAGADTWTRPVEVAENRVNEPRLGYLPNGELFGAYQDRDTDAVVVLQKGAGALALERDLALGGDSESAEPDLAVSRDGRVAVVWEEDEATASPLVRSAVRGAAGGWTTAMLERPGTSGALPKVAASRDGFVAAWDSRDEGGQAVDATSLGAGTTWGETERLVGQLPGNGESDVAAAPDGSATVVWETVVDDTPVVRGRTRSGLGTWDDEQFVATTDGGGLSGPQVAAYADGSFTGVWREDLGDQLVRAGLLDRTGPVIDAAPPATTTIGVPLSLSAVVEDRWNAVEASRWILPDGSEVPGTDATWTPAVLGDNTLRVRAQDTLGNETVRSFVVRVGPAVVPPVDEPPVVGPPVVRPPAVVPPGPPAAVVPGPVPVAPSPVCAAPYVELVGIRAGGTARAPLVRLSGVTGPSLVGRTVEVRRDGREVGTATVRADRSVSVSVPAPRGTRARARARYRLVVGEARSRALKATRGTSILRTTRLSSGALAISGRVATLPRRTRLTVTGTAACGDAAPTRSTVRTDTKGRFRVTLRAPSGAGTATIYRITAPGDRTVSLPVVVTGR